MLALAIFVPPRPGAAAPSGRALVDREGWARMGTLERGELSIDVLARGTERLYSVRRGGRQVAERIDGAELRRSWGFDPDGVTAQNPGPIMMVDTDAEAVMPR
jgi:hypothetical protein